MSETTAQGGEFGAPPVPNEEIRRVIAYYRARLELIDQLIVELSGLDSGDRRGRTR